VRVNKLTTSTHTHTQGPPTQPLVIGVGASKMPPATSGVKTFAAPTLLSKALLRNVLRGAGGTAGRPVMLLPLNEYCTTKCCSKCGADTEAPMVRDYKWGHQRESTRLRSCPQCKAKWQEEEERSRAVGSGAGSSDVRQTHHEYQMHRDLNAAWNLWNVCCAEYGGANRPAYLCRH